MIIAHSRKNRIISERLDRIPLTCSYDPADSLRAQHRRRCPISLRGVPDSIGCADRARRLASTRDHDTCLHRLYPSHIRRLPDNPKKDAQSYQNAPDSDPENQPQRTCDDPSSNPPHTYHCVGLSCHQIIRTTLDSLRLQLRLWQPPDLKRYRSDFARKLFLWREPDAHTN